MKPKRIPKRKVLGKREWDDAIGLFQYNQARPELKILKEKS